MWRQTRRGLMGRGLVAGLVVSQVGLVVGGVAPMAAQQVRNDDLTAEAQIQQRRYQFQLMEGVLENAVRQGAVEVAMRAEMALPIGTLFMGRPKAKGFPLDGYGVVFDIEIPIILESQVLLSQMAPVAPSRPDLGTRAVSGRGAPAPTTRSASGVDDDPMTRSPIVTDPFLADPNAFYRSTVRERLVEVMLDYSRSLGVPAGEWLSIVARSEEDPAPNLRKGSPTMILRIKGEDLEAFHAGRLTREETRKRVVESQF